MYKRIRKIVSCITFAMLVFSLAACGKAEQGELTSEAIQRDTSAFDDAEIYIDDEAIALAGEAEASDEKQAAAFEEVAMQAFNYVNKIRIDAGLSALVWNTDLVPSTNVRASEASQLFSHTRPDGSDWWTVNSKLMYGENLARGYSSANSAVEAWMNSPTHKANIMKADYKTIAIAITMGSDGQWYWAQEFGY